MTWTSGTVYGFDVESTGVDVRNDRIVTATVVKIVNGQHVDSREWLINPGIEIPAGATEIHGITTDHAREHGVVPSQALAEIAATVSSVLNARLPLAVMNAAYDMSILTAELRRYGLSDLSVTAHDWSSLVDPFVLARGLDTINRNFAKGRKYRLPDLCKRYRVPFEETHDATADATGAALLAIAVVDSEPQLIEMGPGRLFTAQQTWRRNDQARFRDWVVKNGKEAEYGEIDGGWPLHTALADVAVSA